MYISKGVRGKRKRRKENIIYIYKSNGPSDSNKRCLDDASEQKSVVSALYTRNESELILSNRHKSSSRQAELDTILSSVQSLVRKNAAQM